MYDVAIIGSGLAGISAALTLQLHRKNILWLGHQNLSEKIRKAEKIANYPGLSMISGSDFCETLKNQVQQAGLSITQENVTGVYDGGSHWMLATAASVYEAKSVILTTGVESAKSVEGEEHFLGHGVSYCATCDGFLYKGKTIAVVCTTKDLEHEVEYLATIADKIWLLALYKNPEVKASNVELILDVPQKIDGSKTVEALSCKRNHLPCSGIFILKNAISPAVLVSGLAMDGQHIAVKRDMSTNLRGIYAAGDVTGRPYQYAKAAGEGNVAAHSVISYLNHLE